MLQNYKIKVNKTNNYCTIALLKQKKCRMFAYLKKK